MNRSLPLLLLALSLLALSAGFFLVSKRSPSSEARHGDPDSTPPKSEQALVSAPEETKNDKVDGHGHASPASRSTSSGFAQAIPARPEAMRVPANAEEPLPGGPPPLPLAPDFLEAMVDPSETRVTFALPGGRMASGTVELLDRDEHGILLVQGRLDSPRPGFYFFQRQTESGVLGAFFGHARFDDGDIAYRAEATGAEGAPMLVARRLDQVVCVGLPLAPPAPEPGSAAPAGDAPGARLDAAVPAPQTHPIDIPIPGYQSVVPLESLPGASGVVFLDFEGGEGPWAGWGDFYVEPAGTSSSQVRHVWARVAEDFQPFNINVTTDRKVFENAPRNSRQRVMVTRTSTASPGNGGVANYWSFNATSDIVCWAFYTTGKNSAEVISHEVGHTMGLSHDGQDPPDEPRKEYYSGHDAGEGWAPIMGSGYGRNVTQWSKGEYPDPTNTEDDLAILTNNNNTVDYRGDDHGGDHESASYLEIFSDGTVSNEGIVERSGGVDAFGFTTGGGAVSLRIRPVDAGPNLDIRAELFNDLGALLLFDNPKDELDATINSVLEPGDYTLRVESTGYPARGGYGYSDYASAGAYLISGTVENGVTPDRLFIAENSAAGAVVGTVSKRNDHGRRSLIYAIESGNENGGFSIDSSRGEILVADASQLDFEALSSRWDDPAAMEMFVSITNPEDPTLNELNRVVITVTDLNEPPILSRASALTIFSGTAEGTELMMIEATDPDHFDVPLFSLVGGNSDGVFGIDPYRGMLLIADAVRVETATTYPLVVRAVDQGVPPLQVEAAIEVTLLPLSEGYTPGSIARTFFEDISGNGISALTGSARFPNDPDSEELLTSFNGKSHGNSYGSTMRGYILVPETGNYRFWIASDDGGELLFNEAASRNGATTRATVPGHTGPFEYDQYDEQQTVLFALTAGQVCYIEARQKEGSGDDHVSVAWEGPGFSQEVIPGRYLAPYYQNYAPTIPEQSFVIREGAYEGTSLGLVTVMDVNAAESHHSFEITGGTGFGIFNIEADSGRIVLAEPEAFSLGDSFTLELEASDTGSRSRRGSGTVTVNVLDGGVVEAPEIVHQIWDNFTGETVAELESDSRFPGFPDRSRTIDSFAIGTNLGSNYGSRIRAYLIPPATGNYRLYVSSDDHSELRFSTSSDPAGAVTVASVTGWVAAGEWAEQVSQGSGEFWLVSGERYYIEALHRQGTGGAHLEVGWTGPDHPEPSVIPGESLAPFDINAPPAWTNAPYAFAAYPGAPQGTLVGTLTAIDPEGGPLVYAILGGNGEGAFQMDPATGVISVADGSGLVAGEPVNLEVGAQDDGTGGAYPYKSVETTVVIAIGGMESWRVAKFGADADNPILAGDNADPDGDGFNNLIEYALDLEPLAAGGREALVLQTETVNGDIHLRLTVTKNPAAADVLLEVEVTGGLNEPASWSTSDALIELDSPTTLTVRDKVPVSAASSRFIRLNVTR